MSNFTIKSRTEGTFRFFMNGDSGYIFLESEGCPGTLGHQIGVGGKLLGEMVYATESDFEAKCRKWYRSYRKLASKYGQVRSWHRRLGDEENELFESLVDEDVEEDAA